MLGEGGERADEMNVHSFRIHPDGSITWVRWRANPPAQAPQRKSCEAKERQKKGEPSKRVQNSIERARKHHELHEKAVRFRCAAALRHWRQSWCGAEGASAASATLPRVSGDGLPGSATVSVMDADDASPSRASREVGVPMLPPQPKDRWGHRTRLCGWLRIAHDGRGGPTRRKAAAHVCAQHAQPTLGRHECHHVSATPLVDLCAEGST